MAKSGEKAGKSGKVGDIGKSKTPTKMEIGKLIQKLDFSGIIDEDTLEVDVKKILEIPSPRYLNPQKIMMLLAEDSGKTLRWSLLVNETEEFLKGKELEFEIWKKKKLKEIRSNLNEEEEKRAKNEERKPVKPTETQIKETLLLENEYQERQQEIYRIDKARNNLLSTAIALKTRGERLTSISSMFKWEGNIGRSNFTDEPEEKSERKKTEMDRAKENKKRGGNPWPKP